MGAAIFIMNNNRLREEAARRRRVRRRKDGFWHDHTCPICHTLVGAQYCFCDEYNIVDGECIGYSQRCSAHVRYWIGLTWAAVIVAGIGGFIWWMNQPYSY